MPSAGPNTFQVYSHGVTQVCCTPSRCAKPQRVSRKQHLQWRSGFQIKDLKTQFGRVNCLLVQTKLAESFIRLKKKKKMYQYLTETMCRKTKPQ